MVTKVTDKTLTEHTGSGLTIVDLWAPWCGPCLMMEPVIDELEEDFKDDMQFVKLNIDENKETALEYDVMSIPSFLLFKDGKAIEKVVGYHDKSEFSKYLSEKVTQYKAV
ncbi:thioredoxin [Dellaglioa sp. P0083]|uniref:thioredoxin n=1 Tax=Dellaglioa kimchii TaxID=3344667 RepID=UPI0038D4A043